MKQTKLIYLFITVMLCSGSSCVKTEAQYPGVSVYKTRGDYFDKITVGINDKDKIFRGPFDSFKDDTIPKNRARLINGYVLDAEGDLKYDAFLNMSIREYNNWLEEYDMDYLPNDTAWKYMLDKDPYIEYYRAKDRDMFIGLDTTGLNQIILDGQLEKYFNKLK